LYDITIIDHTQTHIIRCSSFQKLINRSLRSPSLFLSLKRTLRRLSFSLHRFPVCLSHYIILLGGFVRWPALARLFVLLVQRCASAAVAAIQTNRFSVLILFIITIPADAATAAAASDSSDSPSSRLSSRCLSVPDGRRRHRRARARSPTTNLRIVFHYYYYFSLQSEKIARIASRDRLSPSRVGSSVANKNALFFYFSILITTVGNIIIYYFIICVARRIIHTYTHTPIVHLPWCAVCSRNRRRLRVDLSSIYRFFFYI